MINHISLNAILLDVENPNSLYRQIKCIRSYKNSSGVFEEDIFPCIMWNKNNKNSLFSYKTGTLVSIDGRIENIDGQICIVIECLSFLANGSIEFKIKGV